MTIMHEDYVYKYKGWGYHIRVKGYSMFLW